MKTTKSHEAAQQTKEPPGRCCTQEVTKSAAQMNEPFRGKDFSANKRLSGEEFAKLEAAIGEEEELLFVIVGDLNIHSKYASSFLAVTDQTVYGFDPAFPNGVRTHPLRHVKRAYVKRFYGNAMLVFSQDDSHKEYVDLSREYVQFIRFSYKVASIYDAAANFIQNVAEGKPIQAEMQAMEAAFEKQFCACPQCGRALIRPGAPCMNCQSKNKLLQKLGKYVLPYKYSLLFCLLLSLITTAMSLVPPLMTKTLVDEVFPSGNTRKLTWCVLPMRFYDRSTTGSVINRISSDAGTIREFTLRLTQEVVVQFFLLIGIVVIIFVMNWQLTLLSLVPVPFVVTGSRIFGKKIKPFYRRIWRRWSAVTSLLTDTIPGIRVIKAFTNEKNSQATFSAYNGEWLKTSIRASRITTLFPHVVNFVMSCGSLLIWSVGGNLVIENPDFVSAGLLVSFISYTSMFYGPVNFFANLNDSYQNALNSAERILDIIDAEPEPDFAEGQHPEKLHGRIEFRNVSFSFDRSKKTLSNINLVIEPGDIVGIVGTTGAGKSTLINLLMRYYDHYDGQILMDGIDIRKIDLEFYRSEIGYVQQEPMMFHESIYQNIAYGTRNPPVEAVIHAAEVANAHEFICRLPDGYDTILGERGTGLSGGERQRLSIARAVLKNPSILFLDEATASVDSETESLIQDAIDRLIRGRTTLMIAHRLSTLRKANKIIVVDKGEILEMGSPEELMALKGKYYKLIQIQTMSDQIRKTKEEERFD